MVASNRNITGLLIVIILAIVTYAVLTMPDQRSTGQRIGDAVDALPQGLDKASRQLEKRTPGEKLGDAVKDTGQDIKDATGKN